MNAIMQMSTREVHQCRECKAKFPSHGLLVAHLTEFNFHKEATSHQKEEVQRNSAIWVRPHPSSEFAERVHLLQVSGVFRYEERAHRPSQQGGSSNEAEG